MSKKTTTGIQRFSGTQASVPKRFVFSNFRLE